MKIIPIIILIVLSLYIITLITLLTYISVDIKRTKKTYGVIRTEDVDHYEEIAYGAIKYGPFLLPQLIKGIYKGV